MFVFVFEWPASQAVVINATDSETAVRKLAEQLSNLVDSGMSDDPDDYWYDIAQGNILVFQSGDKIRNVCDLTDCKDR
jgi:hypothetical protein